MSVTIQGAIAVAETEKAIKVEIDGEELWVPKSQIDDDSEVFEKGHEGKLVVTLEAASAREIAGRMEQIQSLEHVISAALVYQHNEALEAMMEEVPYEDHQA